MELLNYIEAIEDALGVKVEKELLTLQLGDAPDTYADMEYLVKEIGYKTSMLVKKSVKNFAKWFKNYHNY